MMNLKKVTLLAFVMGFLGTTSGFAQQPRNIVFILSDDHRYDYMDFHPESPDFLKTPGMDRMAREGAHLANAFVTTSLCSPSRASILTGQYSFRHGAVDNSNPMKAGTRLFPEQLQQAGYQTAYFGKWHIGEASDDPQPGFDRWVSFQGQGVYYNPTLNFDGERRQVEGYTTDLLTDYAIDWMSEGRDKEKPFFVYLSHKAVHAEFYPAERHDGLYADADLAKPQSMKYSEQNYEGKPDWVREQRFSWHGVDYMYHNREDHPQTLDEIITEYSETLMGVDESISRVLDYLEANGLAQNTLVIYMGDNGFMLGEHGLIDKRQAYEESMRVPMLAWAPGFIDPGTTIDENILNYQYFWEHAFPQTPTTYAIRGDRYKYIYYHGIWDKNELYDLKSDPDEMHNLINLPSQQARVDSLRREMFNIFEANGATDVRFRRPPAYRLDEKKMH